MQNLTIQNLIVKLKSLRGKSQTSSSFMLDTNEVLLQRKEKEILSKTGLTNYNTTSLRTLSVYLLTTNLNKFTVEELKILLKIDFSDLENNSTEINPDLNFDFNNPPIDSSGKYFNLENPKFKLEETHSRLLSVNKNKSFSFFINYIISKL